MDDELAQMLAERAITKVLHKYVQGVDRRRFEQIEECYWPEAVDDHGAFSGSIKDYIAWLKEVLPNMSVSSHNFTNILIDVDVAAGTAESETYSLNMGKMSAPPHDDHLAAIRYIDRWERRDTEWRIIHRKIERDWILGSH